MPMQRGDRDIHFPNPKSQIRNSLPPVKLLHQCNEVVEEVEGVVRSGARLGVILH